MRLWRQFPDLALAAFVALSCSAQTATPPAGTVISVASLGTSDSSILQAGNGIWTQAAPKRVALNRTPPLYDTDEPSQPEIATTEVRVARASGKLFVQLRWQDDTHDVASLQAIPEIPPEERFIKVSTQAQDRFFDAAAVMVPSSPVSGLNPSLQMGDAEHPVRIYYWNAVRGAMLMEGRGRATTQPTGQTFPATSAYGDGLWTVTFEMPDQPAGAPLAFAVWNGSQSDRDGRKYFSVWYTVE